jgi:hypothetical protein
MYFQISLLDDFLAMCAAYSTFMRVFYYAGDVLMAYGFPATTKHLLVVVDNNGGTAETALLAAIPGAIKLDQSLNIEDDIQANTWPDLHKLLDGIAVEAAPTQVVYFIQNGNFHFVCLDPSTGVTFTCVDYSHAEGLEDEITAAFPTALKFTGPVEILEAD